MSCFGCIQKIKHENAQHDKAILEALALAKHHNETFAIYTNEHGETCYIKAGESTGYPVTRYITPNMQHS